MDIEDLRDVLTREDYVRLFKNLGFSINGERPVDGWITHLYRPSYLGDDENPDCSVNIDRGSFKDHGSQWEGSVFDLAMEAHDLSFPESIEWVANKVATTAVEDIEQTSNMGVDPISVEKVHGFNKRLLESNENVVDNLRSYLVGRGLTLETLKKLKFGYWNRNSGHWLIIPYGSEDSEVNAYKIFKISENGGWYKESGSKVIRTCGSGTLMGKQFLTSNKSIVLTEGELDFGCLFQEDINALSSTTGASGWKHSYSEYIRGAAPPKVYIAYDQDEAGVKGAKKTARLLEKYDIPSYNVELPQGKDINDVYLEEGIGYIKNQISKADRIEIEEADTTENFEEYNTRKLLLLIKNKWRKLPEKERSKCIRLINQIVSMEGYSVTKL